MAFSLLGGPTSSGLVIRTHDVELLSMRGKKVLSRVRVPRSGQEDAALIQAIQQAVASSHLNIKKLAVSMPTQDVLIRFFTMPMIPKGEWETAVQFEVRKYIPFKPEALVWDYKTFHPKGSNRVEVIFGAIQRSAFERLQNLLASAGVQPTMMEPRCVSVSRLANRLKAAANATEFVCLVDLDEDIAHLTIAKDGLPYLTRDINLLATIPGEPQAVPALPGAGVDPQAHKLLSELSVSMDFFQRENPSCHIGQVLLFGDENVMGSWCAWLADQLHCSVELGNMLLAQHVEGVVPLSSASAIGLLQAGREPKLAWLDFLKRSQAPIVAKHRVVQPTRTPATVWLPSAGQLALVSIVAALILGSVWVKGDQQIQGERQRLEQLMRARPPVRGLLTRMDQKELVSIKERAQSQLALLRQILEKRSSVAAKFDALARVLPEGVWLTGLTFEERMDSAGVRKLLLTINGACFLESGDELETIQAFEEQLRQHAVFFNGFSTARLGQVNERIHTQPQRQYTYRTFQVQCQSERAL